MNQGSRGASTADSLRSRRAGEGNRADAATDQCAGIQHDAPISCFHEVHQNEAERKRTWQYLPFDEGKGHDAQGATCSAEIRGGGLRKTRRNVDFDGFFVAFLTL